MAFSVVSKPVMTFYAAAWSMNTTASLWRYGSNASEDLDVIMSPLSVSAFVRIPGGGTPQQPMALHALTEPRKFRSDRVAALAVSRSILSVAACVGSMIY